VTEFDCNHSGERESPAGLLPAYEKCLAEKKVLLVDDDPAMLRLMEGYVISRGYQVLKAMDGWEALRILRAENPRLLVTDCMMPNMDGMDLCRAIRSNEDLGFVYTIMVTGHADEERLVEAFDAGVDDFLPKPFTAKEILARLRAGQRIIELEAALAQRTSQVQLQNARLEIANERLLQLATTDELTGLHNRRAAMERLRELWDLARRYDLAISCILLDIDHFKHVNDVAGHDGGDRVLCQITRVLRQTTRTCDLVCRMGGEEFLILCPNTTLEKATLLGERLRRAVETSGFTNASAFHRVTVSIGVAERSPIMVSAEAMLKAADNALYSAKRAGRNRLCVAGQHLEPIATTPVIEDRSDRLPGERLETHGENARVLSTMLDFSCRLSLMETRDEILDQTLRTTASLTQCSRASILLPDAEGTNLVVAWSIGDCGVLHHISLPIKGTAVGRIFTTGKLLLIDEKSRRLAESEQDAEGATQCTQEYAKGLFLGVPVLSMPLNSAAGVVGVLNLMGRIDGTHFRPNEIEYIELVTRITAAALQGWLSRCARDEARDSIVVGLAKLVEQRDRETGRHVERVTRFCELLAETLCVHHPEYKNIDTEFITNLKRAAPLHDVGKVGIPDHILLKPGRLSPDERAIMQTHCTIGADYLRTVTDRAPGVAFLQMAVEIAESHHEWYDGSGYPHGLKGSAIPLAARITALADAYDAMRSRRPYKNAMSHKHAREIVVGASGTQFDPVVVSAFLICEKEFERVSAALPDRDGVTTGETSPCVEIGSTRSTAKHLDSLLPAAVN
jgi:diguanylate cyclase (GGDEF)-like protein